MNELPALGIVGSVFRVKRAFNYAGAMFRRGLRGAVRAKRNDGTVVVEMALPVRDQQSGKVLNLEIRVGRYDPPIREGHAWVFPTALLREHSEVLPGESSILDKRIGRQVRICKSPCMTYNVPLGTVLRIHSFCGNIVRVIKPDGQSITVVRQEDLVYLNRKPVV